MLGRKQSLRQTVTAGLAASGLIGSPMAASPGAGSGTNATGTGNTSNATGNTGPGPGSLMTPLLPSTIGGGGGASGGMPGLATSTLGAAMGAGQGATLLDPASVAGFGLGAFELDEVIRARTLWWESSTVRWFMRFCAFLSLVSVSTNTSYTFNIKPELQYYTFVIDIFVTVIFTIEFVSKLKIRGSYAYFHDRWAQFDSIMLFCLIASLILHVFEIIGYVERFSPLSMIRAPRPLIMVRLVRVFLSFSMPRARITQIFLRSSQQIYNVTLFFLFFMSLFGLLGVQFFSKLHHHCVLIDNYTDNYEPSIHQLAIPDTFCSPVGSYGHQCPPSMMCVEIHNATGYSGFDNLAYALFTVYHSSSQEGWYHVMYQAMDSMDVFRSAFYFVTLIFFLAWLVKNVFIAVITETFNEIRVQFQQMWGERAQITAETIPSILIGDDRWRLVQMTDSESGRSKAPHLIRNVLSTAAFQIFVMVMIVINAMINASIKFDHSGRLRQSFYQTIYPSEVFFTVFFNIEVILKIWCYGFRLYIKRSLHKLELVLAIGSSLHIIPPLYMQPPFVYFQVLRIVRLIKASPVLEDFVYKIFGPGKKLGSLIIFTMCLLIVTSSISMQLFCCFAGYNKFQSFPEAFMSMFQILTQEGWTEVMNETILRSGRNIGPLVAIYFILYHLFVSLIVLSLFVAVILDNLELDEDIKKVKQLKAREQSAGFNEELPLRLRLFESFPDSPQMTRLHKSANEFAIPKVRDSFMRSFIESPTTNTTTSTVANGKIVPVATSAGVQVGTTTLATSTVAGPMVGSYHFSGTSSTLGSSTTATGIVGLSTSTHRQISLYNGYLAAAAAASGTNRALLAPSSTFHMPNGSSPGSTTVVNGFGSIRPSSSAILAMSAHRAKAITLHHAGHAQPPIKLLNAISKGRHSSPLLRRVQVACIVSDSNNQRLLLGESQGLPGTGGASTYSRTVTGGATVGTGNRTAMRRSVRGNMRDEVGTEESQSAAMAGNAAGGATVRGQDFDFKMLQRKRQQAEMRRTQRESDLRENHPFFDTPLLIVGRESRFRLICQSIVSAKYDPHVRDPITGKERKMRYKGAHELLGLVPYCDWLMIIITTFSCASMMCETGSIRVANTPWLIIAEYTFIIAMAIELTLKTLADGLLFTPNAYLANVAGVMDFSIFGVSMLFLCVLPERVPPGSWQQTLMVLRCIRPLRIFSLVPHMRKVVYELCRGFKEIALVSVLLIVLLFVFASVGVHMFGGRLARCNDPCITKREECVGVFMRQVHVTRMKFEHQSEYMPAVLVPRVWANPRRFNFDSLGNGILALFEVLSFKGWLDIRDVILARLTPFDAVYIHVFVFLGCMIGLTLFVGVVIANYGENKGTALLTVDQRRWCDLKKRLKIAQPLHLPPRPDHHQARAIIYDITQHIAFKRAIAILVLVNSSLLCVSWDYRTTKDESEYQLSHNLANVSAGLTCAFVFEVLMKMIAFTPRGYWQSRRNRYDLFVTVCGVLWLALHFSLMNKTSNSIGFIVVILRFFTITGKHATLKMLMLTVAVSVYKSFFIIMGLFLLILCYALAGVILFGSVKYGENVSRHANFRIAPLGVITLFRIVTGEDWNKIMHDAMLSPPFCTPGENFWSTDCGNYYASLAFFCSFYVCITYIVLNLLVAIIMENFSLFYSNEEDALLSYADIRNFQNTWNLVDIQQRGMIPVSRVKFVLRLLKGRLEVEPNKDRLLFKHMCHEMERLHNGEDVTFHDVLNMLSYRSVDIRKSLQLEELLAREELEFLIEEEVAKATIRAWLDKHLRRIKREKQHQSLLHSLRAQNEPQTATTTGSGGTAFFGTSIKGDDDFAFLFDQSPPPKQQSSHGSSAQPDSATAQVGTSSTPSAQSTSAQLTPSSANHPPVPPSTLSLEPKPEPLQLGPVPKDLRDESGQLKKATLAKPQSFSISSSGDSMEDSSAAGPTAKESLRPSDPSDTKSKADSGAPEMPSQPTSSQPPPQHPHKKVEFKTQPESERRSKRFDDHDHDQPKPGPSRLGSRKGPVRQQATTLLMSETEGGSGTLPNGGAVMKDTRAPWSDSSASKTIALQSINEYRRPSESGSETSTSASSKFIKKTTFKTDLDEEITNYKGEVVSPEGKAEVTSPESHTASSSSRGPASRRFVSLHSYPPTSAAMDADFNLSHVIRNYKPRSSEPSTAPPTTSSSNRRTPPRETSVESDDEASDQLPTRPLAKKPPLPPKPKGDLPFSARMKTLRKDRPLPATASTATSAAAPSTLLQSKLQSTISKRIKETGTKEGVSLLNNVEGRESPSDESASEEENLDKDADMETAKKQLKDELVELEDSGDLEGSQGSKKFNVLRAQILVNEVHDWWLMHLS